MASIFVIALIIALGIKKVQEASLMKKHNKLLPLKVDIINYKKQTQQIQLNTNAQNPEIIGTTMSNVICIISIVLVVYILYNQYWHTASDFSILSKEFVVVQYELTPYLLSSVCVPLGLYFQNKSFRKFFKNYYKSFVFNNQCSCPTR